MQLHKHRTDTCRSPYYVSVAQPVERRSEEPGVASSTLAGGTNYSVSSNGRTSVFDPDNGSSILSAETTKSII